MHRLESHAGGVAVLSSYAAYSGSNHIDEAEEYYQESTLCARTDYIEREKKRAWVFVIRTVLLRYKAVNCDNNICDM